MAFSVFHPSSSAAVSYTRLKKPVTCPMELSALSIRSPIPRAEAALSPSLPKALIAPDMAVGMAFDRPSTILFFASLNVVPIPDSFSLKLLTYPSAVLKSDELVTTSRSSFLKAPTNAPPIRNASLTPFAPATRVSREMFARSPNLSTTSPTASRTGPVTVRSGSQRFSPMVRILLSPAARPDITGVKASSIGPPISCNMAPTEFLKMLNCALALAAPEAKLSPMDSPFLPASTVSSMACFHSWVWPIILTRTSMP